MPISGRFEGDFDSFYAAVEGAELRLKSMTEGGARVESQMNRVADSLSGRKLITDATVMSAAVERLGGVSSLTSKELARMGPIAEEAVAKMRALGNKDIPDNMLALANASQKTQSGLTGAAKAIADTDNVLDLFGVNLGPARRALDDLGNASGKTAGDLGVMGTASLAAGAAMGGWQTGRWIAGILGTDEAIGKLTARLLGLGDVAGEQAAAGQDNLARASERAGRAITTQAEALKVNEEWARKTTESNQKLVESYTRAAASAGNVESYRKLREEMLTFRSEGFLDDLTRDLKTNAFTQAELAAQYRLSAQAVAAFAKEIQDDAAAQKSLEDDAKRRLAARVVAEKEKADALDKARKAEEDARKETEKYIAAQQAAADAVHARAVAEADAQLAKNKQADADRIKAAQTGPTPSILAVTQMDVSTQAGARAFLGTPQMTVEDFIRAYADPMINAPLSFRLQQFEDYQRMRVTALQTVGQSPTVNVQVSGVLDPRTVTELSSAVAQKFVAQSGQKAGFY